MKWCCVMISIFCLCMPSYLLAQAEKPVAPADARLWIASVGVSQFRDTRIAETPYCSNDARGLAAVFVKQGVAPGQILTLTDERATLSNCMAIFVQLRSKVRTEDTVLFFYSGHSAVYDNNNTYLFTHDTIADNLADTALAVNDLRQLLGSLPCRQRVVITDASRKNRARKQLPAVEQIHKMAAQADFPIAVLTATRTQEYGWEAPEQQKHTAFVMTLLHGLAGDADKRPQDGRVSAAELFDYTIANVPRLTERAQHPVARYSASWPQQEIVMCHTNKSSDTNDTRPAQPEPLAGPATVADKIADDKPQQPLAANNAPDRTPAKKPLSDKPQLPLAQNKNSDTDEPDDHPVAQKNKKKGVYYALIIANGDYRDPAWPKLDTPVANGKALVTVLQREYGFARSNIRYLANANRKQMVQALGDLVSVVDAEDSLLLCYFGHTLCDEDGGQTFIVPVDAKASAGNRQLLPARLLARSLRQLALRARHVLAVFDGGLQFDAAFDDDETSERLPQLKERLRARSNKTCQLIVSTRKEYKDEVHRQGLSAFAYLLLEALRQNHEDSYLASQIATSLQKKLRKAGEEGVRYVMLPVPEETGEQFVFTRSAGKKEQTNQDDE